VKVLTDLTEQTHQASGILATSEPTLIRQRLGMNWSQDSDRILRLTDIHSGSDNMAPWFRVDGRGSSGERAQGGCPEPSAMQWEG
jgi:hypothetical protein